MKNTTNGLINLILLGSVFNLPAMNNTGYMPISQEASNNSHIAIDIESLNSNLNSEMTYYNFIPKLKKHFKDYVDEKGTLKVKSPTLAYLFNEKFENSIQEYISNIILYTYDWQRSPLFDKVKKAIEKEIELCNKGYFVFYHGQDIRHRLVQDIVKILYETKYNKQLRDDFIFLRNEDYINNHQNVNEFLSSKKIEPFFDRDNDIRKFLLSTNISLFHNAQKKVECTFNYFAHSISNLQPNQEQEIANLFLDNLDLLKLIYPIIKSTLSNMNPESSDPYDDDMPVGNLIQIFIPEKDLNNLSYMAIPGGEPEESCVNKNEEQNAIIYNACIKERLLERQNYYKKDVSFREQARIYLDPKYFMNPESEIKIFGYSVDPDYSVEKNYYDKNVLEIKSIISNYFDKKNINMNISYVWTYDDLNMFNEIFLKKIKEKNIDNKILLNLIKLISEGQFQMDPANVNRLDRVNFLKFYEEAIKIAKDNNNLELVNFLENANKKYLKKIEEQIEEQNENQKKQVYERRKELFIKATSITAGIAGGYYFYKNRTRIPMEINNYRNYRNILNNRFQNSSLNKNIRNILNILKKR